MNLTPRTEIRTASEDARYSATRPCVQSNLLFVVRSTMNGNASVSVRIALEMHPTVGKVHTSSKKRGTVNVCLGISVKGVV